MGRILTFNCHEAWVSQLDALERPFDIIDGLPGRYTNRWDERMRPRPRHGRLIHRRDVASHYDVIIGHSLTDLLEVKELVGPRLLVLHVSLHHRVEQANMGQAPADLAQKIAQYLALVGGHVVAVTAFKRDSWGLEADVVESFADPDDYFPPSGHLARGLRIANQIGKRERYLAWDFHQAAFRPLPIDVVGHNPDLPGVEPAAGWDDLKAKLAAHRFLVHTADPELEDGFNMAVMEALAAGLAVVGNAHPTSPLVHGQSALLTNDPWELRKFARRLLEDRAVAARIGAAGRKLVRERFSRLRWVTGMSQAIQRATARWHVRDGAG